MPCGNCKLEISELTGAISRKPVLHAVDESPVQETWKTHGRPAEVSLFPIIFSFKLSPLLAGDRQV